MKKFFAILLTGVLTLGLAACGGSEPAADDGSITLKIGATPTPHAEILTAAQQLIASNEPHATLKIAFTPDEEIGRGADLFDVESPLRVALVNMLGLERFAILNTFFQLENPIVVKDNWVVLEYMWPHLAYRSVTIFIDTQSPLMYVQWVNPDESELLLFYELSRGEQASPATILGREIPESMRDGICYGLLPDFDPDQTTNEGSVL